ncbi:hypothetical protein SPRG_00259 [Saprolegnia parasitica CBS 223.65]|uniref:Uncharacterized protein n=1 Tax=Saprolegnia parasitica (strain CBS 223.65) TaxID=695850 RepID=A0A067CXG7_SAPPC|nr:hypothetical protein SPRG_00259 [Saprolegnia parasitica CBS 223.65]KDO35409.1 hypothetical protein SPRG_00259 [Saprolegnia parasitica CBS 223.65]|eukprot:XP_012193752.1 hypothetical protein SPRG_00259 [Saprolegnia parasitica CBS 223.65]
MGKKEEPKEVAVPVPIEPEKPPAPTGYELVFSLFSQDDTTALLSAATTADAQATLQRLLGVNHYATNARSRAHVDLCHYALAFCKQAFASDVQKTALMLLVVHRLFTTATTTEATLSETYHELTTLLTQHSVELPPTHVGIFSTSDVQRIVEYLGSTFFQHYAAYQVAFRCIPDVVRTTQHVVIETPMTPTPLAGATKLESSGP